MPDSIVKPKCYGTAELADGVVENYAKGEAIAIDYTPSHSKYCREAGVEWGKCGVVDKFIHKGQFTIPDGDEYLELKGFCREFINHLGGYDGKRAMRERVKRLQKKQCTKILWWNTCNPAEKRFYEGQSIGNMGHFAKFVPDAIEALEGYAYSDKDEAKRVMAIRELGEVGSVEAIRALTKMLDVGDSVMREAASEGLTRHPTGEEELPVLIKALSDKNNSVRLDAIKALTRNESDHKKYIPLIVMLTKTTWDIEQYIHSRQKHNDIDEPVVFSLINELYSDNARTRYNIAVALAAIGADAFMALPILEDMATGDPYPICRNAAGEAYYKIVEKV